MAILNIPKNYDALTTPTEQQIDAMKEAIETFFNTTKLGSNNFSDGAITAGKIEAGSVITAKVVDEAVTNVKRAVCNIATGTTALGSSVTASITTTGNPVWIIPCSSHTATQSYLQTGLGARFRIKRDSTTLVELGNLGTYPPPTVFGVVSDAPPAGAYVYTLERSAGSGDMVNVSLHVIEL